MRIEGSVDGQRVRLRSYDAQDLAFVCEMWLDEENGKYLSDPTAAYTDETFQRALDGLADSAFGYYFVVELRENGERIGTCCAFPDEDDVVYDIGYCIHKQQWHRGYGAEVVELLEQWCFEHGVSQITAEVAVENTASVALLQRCGYEVLRESEFQKYGMDIRYPSLICGKMSRNASALYRRAMQHIYGDGVREDNELAFRLLTQAWMLGHAEAAYNLGICYHYGYGTEVNLPQAFARYRDAAEAGYSKGMELLGRCYNRGIGVPKDRELAEFWLQRVLQSDDPEAVAEAVRELQIQ